MEVGQIINKISHRLRRRSQAVQKSLGISESQGRILNYILVESRKHPVHPKDLEEEFGLRSSTVTGVLSGLEQEGLILRVPDSGDRRQKILVFTEKAEKIRTALQAEIDETETRLLSGISPEKKECFLQIARQMLTNLSDTNLSDTREGGDHDE